MALQQYLVQYQPTPKEEISSSGSFPALVDSLSLTDLSLSSLSDAGVCFPIQKGLLASRSKIKYFRHNDMDHLQELLEESKKIDEKV